MITARKRRPHFDHRKRTLILLFSESPPIAIGFRCQQTNNIGIECPSQGRAPHGYPRMSKATEIAVLLVKALGLDLGAVSTIVHVIAPLLEEHEYWTIDHLASNHSLSPEQVKRLIESRKIPHIDVGAGTQRAYRVRPEDFRRALAGGVAPAPVVPPQTPRPYGRRKPYPRLLNPDGK